MEQLLLNGEEMNERESVDEELLVSLNVKKAFYLPDFDSDQCRLDVIYDADPALNLNRALIGGRPPVVANDDADSLVAEEAIESQLLTEENQAEPSDDDDKVEIEEDALVSATMERHQTTAEDIDRVFSQINSTEDDVKSEVSKEQEEVQEPDVILDAPPVAFSVPGLRVGKIEDHDLSKTNMTSGESAEESLEGSTEEVLVSGTLSPKRQITNESLEAVILHSGINFKKSEETVDEKSLSEDEHENSDENSAIDAEPSPAVVEETIEEEPLGREEVDRENKIKTSFGVMSGSGIAFIKSNYPNIADLCQACSSDEDEEELNFAGDKVRVDEAIIPCTVAISPPCDILSKPAEVIPPPSEFDNPATVETTIIPPPVKHHQIIDERLSFVLPSTEFIKVTPPFVDEHVETFSGDKQVAPSIAELKVESSPSAPGVASINEEPMKLEIKHKGKIIGQKYDTVTQSSGPDLIITSAAKPDENILKVSCETEVKTTTKTQPAVQETSRLKDININAFPKDTSPLDSSPQLGSFNEVSAQNKQQSIIITQKKENDIKLRRQNFFSSVENMHYEFHKHSTEPEARNLRESKKSESVSEILNEVTQDQEASLSPPAAAPVVEGSVTVEPNVLSLENPSIELSTSTIYSPQELSIMSPQKGPEIIIPTSVVAPEPNDSQQQPTKSKSKGLFSFFKRSPKKKDAKSAEDRKRSKSVPPRKSGETVTSPPVNETLLHTKLSSSNAELPISTAPVDDTKGLNTPSLEAQVHQNQTEHLNPQPHVDRPVYDISHALTGKVLETSTIAKTPDSPLSQYFVVVAIDFGTAFSGYAFSFVRDSDSVHMMARWEGGDPGVINQKTPSILLLTPEGKFHSFGFTARNHYHDLSPEESLTWLYFDNFKMSLYASQECNQHTTILAANGREFPALEAVAMTLGFFQRHALSELTNQCGTEILNSDVRWIVTVPAIWTAPAKQFMRLAAYQAKLASARNPDQLVIALEPEAASVHIRRLRMHQLVPEKPVPVPLSIRGSYVPQGPASLQTVQSQFKLVNRYMVVDCGGGTVDITVHDFHSETGTLHEVYKATGGAHGSCGIDKDFETLLCAIFGEEFISSFKRVRPSGWVVLMMAFESRKRAATPFNTRQNLNVALPFSFIEYHKRVKGTPVESSISKFGEPGIRWSSQGMLRLSPEAMKILFDKTIENIKQCIAAILEQVNGIEQIFLVGGLSESAIVQQTIRDEFSNQSRIIVPQDANLAVLKGAVCFGLDPGVISERCSKLTYGTSVLHRFITHKHPVSKHTRFNGSDWCKDVFDRFVTINQIVRTGDTITRAYTSAINGQSHIDVIVYSTEAPHPKYVTDHGVTKCATLRLDTPNVTSTHRHKIMAYFTFGDTEIKVTAVNDVTGEQVDASIDFLST